MSERPWSAVAWLYAIQGATFVLPILLLPYLTHTLGLAGYGKLAFAQVCAQFITSVSELGLPLIAARQLKTNLSSPAERDIVYSNYHFISASSAFLFSLILCAASFLISNDGTDHASISMMSLLVLASGIAPVWVFQATSKLRLLAIATLVSRVLIVVAMFQLVKSESDGIMAVTILAIFPFLTSCVLIAALHRQNLVRARASYLSVERLKAAFGQGMQVFSGGIFTYVFTYGTAFIVRIVSGDAGVGLYVAADRISGLFRQLFGPVVQGNYAEAAQKFKDGRILQLRRTLGAVLAVVLAIGLSGIAFAWLVPPSVAGAVFGSDFENVVSLFRVQAMTQAVVGIAMITLNLVLIASSNQDGIRVPYGIAAVLHIPLAVTLTTAAGPVGAASAVLLTETFVTVLLISVVVRRKILN